MGYDILYVPEPDYTEEIDIPEEYLDLIPENVNTHYPSVLQMFYDSIIDNSKDNFTFQFQVHAFCKRSNAIWEKILDVIQSGRPYIIITERSVISDKEIFTKNLIDSGSFPYSMISTYDLFWNQMAGKIAQHIKAMVYIKVSTENIEDRIRTRNRCEETGIPKHYLDDLNNRHDKMLEKYQHSMITRVVDWNMNMCKLEIQETITSILKNVITCIL